MRMRSETLFARIKNEEQNLGTWISMAVRNTIYGLGLCFCSRTSKGGQYDLETNPRIK